MSKIMVKGDGAEPHMSGGHIGPIALPQVPHTPGVMVTKPLHPSLWLKQWDVTTPALPNLISGVKDTGEAQCPTTAKGSKAQGQIFPCITHG